MTLTKPSLKLTYEGARTALDAAIAKAREIGVPQDIAIVDDGGHLLAFARMDGARLLSIKTSQTKALSAASHRQPTNRLHVADELRLAFATGGKLTNLKGGLPIVIDGVCVGAIGVGSGTGDQDVIVARAGLAALGAQDFPPDPAS
jgi:glc operon protein GlcG